MNTIFGSGGHITFTGSCTSFGARAYTAMDISGIANVVENVHCEYWQECVRIAENAPSQGTKVSNITGSNAVANVVHILSANASNGTLLNIYDGLANNVIKDDTGI